MSETPSSFEQEEIRRRVHAAERAVELERGRRRRPLGALREDELEHLAGDDLLLRAADELLVALLVRESPRRARPAAVRARHRRLRRAQSVGGVAAQHFRRPERVVEAHEHVRDDEARLREARPGVGDGDRRLDLRRVLVADVADDRLADRLRLVEVDDARAAADERIAAEPAALHRLEQERGAPVLAQAEVCPERGEEIG